MAVVASATYEDIIGLRNSRNIGQLSDGTLIATAFPASGGSPGVFYSTDNGATWQDCPTTLTLFSNSQGGINLVVDENDVIWILGWESSGDNDVFLAGYTFDGSDISRIIYKTVDIFQNSPVSIDHAAFVHPGRSGNTHIAVAVSNNIADAYMRVYEYSGGVLTSVFYTNINVGKNTYSLRLDFRHTGDRKTVQTQPDLFLGWRDPDDGVVEFQKFTVSGTSWSSGTQRLMNIGVSDVDMVYDGTRVLFVIHDGGDVQLTERDLADTTTTTRPGDPATTLSSPPQIAASPSGDVYIFNRNSSGHPVWVKYTRATDSWDGAWTTVEAENANTIRLLRSPDQIGVLWEVLGDTRYEQAVSLNQDPTSPTIDTPNDGTVADVNEQLTFDWTFNDPDDGDTQSAYTLRRRIGAGSYEYWTGAGWQASEDASTKIATSFTEDSMAAGWGADGDADHYYSIKTWDAADAGPSPWSSETRVIPSAQDNPTIDTPADLATVGAQETVTWTVATQTKYRVVISDTSSTSDMDAGTLEFDSGNVVNSGARSVAVTFPTNSVTRYVRLQTWNDEGLLSDIDEHQVSVSFTPPADPTVVVTGETPAGGITIDVSNPGTGATEVSNDIYRRKVGETGSGTLIATSVAVDGSFVDYAVASGVGYEYKARAHGDNGTTADSDWTA